MNRIVRLGLLVAVLALTAACATSPATTGPAGGAGSLDFTEQTLDGRTFAGRDLAGQPAVLWFWSPWCTICQREAAGVARAAQANPSVRFVGVAAQDQVPAMQAFVQRYRMDGFPHLADLDASVWRQFGVTQQPAFAFVAADGRADVVRGALPEQEIAARLATLTGRG